MAIQIYIEGERLDLFQDETITIRSSVQDVRDISKIFTDFSQSFTVPASHRNNNIFKRYYNPDVDGGFDARTRKDGVIDIDTLDFKRGKISLTEVKITNNQPEYYRIVFYGDSVKIKDLLGEDKLQDLEWLDNFNHDYTSDNVKTGLTTGLDFTVDSVLYEKAVCYPLISYKRQFYYDSLLDNTSTDTLVNIAYNALKTNGVDWQELRPALNLKLILQAITEKYGLTFTQNFFSTTLFDQIYINIYNDQSDTLLSGINQSEDVSGTNTNSGSGTLFTYEVQVTPKAGFESIPYKVRLEVNGSIIYESANFLTGTNSVGGAVNPSPENYECKAYVITEQDFEYDIETEGVSLEIFPPSQTTEFNNTYTNQVVDLESSITRQIKDIKVYDFLVGLFKTFNLIVVPEGDDLYINDLQTWYSEGAIWDITPHVSTESETVKKSDIYNILAFKFEDSESILANFYKQNNNRTYGNLEQRLEDDSGQLIDGTTLDIQTIFENPIYERLFDLNGNNQTTIQYGLMADENLNSQVGEPFIMYLPSVSVTANPIGFNDSLGGYEELNGNILMPSHSQQIDTASFNLNFNAEINEYTSQVFTDTLYQRFYADYIGDIFSSKRRLYEFEGRLPLELKNRLKLNDRLIIRDRRYIINSITYNLTDNTEQLELVNDIYDAPLASDILNNSVIEPTSQVYSGSAQTDDFKYIGEDGITASKVDIGDGVSWVTLVNDTSSGAVSYISFDIDENNTGGQRVMQIQMVDGINDPVYTITQRSEGVAILNFLNRDYAILYTNLLTGKS